MVRKKWRWAVFVIVVAVVGLLVGLRLGPQSVPVDDVESEPRPAETSEPRAVDPLQAWQIDTEGFGTQLVPTGRSYLFPLTDPARLALPSGPITQRYEPAVINQWVQANRGADAHRTTLRLTVTAKKKKLVLTDLRVVALRCTQPTITRPTAIKVQVGPDVDPDVDHQKHRSIRFELDEARTVRSIDGGTWKFPLRVRARTVIDVEADVARRQCAWKLRLEYTVDGRDDHVEISNGAQLFRTAPEPGDGRPDWTTDDALAFRRNRFLP